MNEPEHRSSVKLLGWPFAAAVLALAAAVLFILGSLYYLDVQQRGDALSKRALEAARQRVDNANQEAADLRTSVDIFKQLTDRGVFNTESRLDWIELFKRLKTKHRLIALGYELAPQRQLQLPGGRVFPSIDPLGSRIKLTVQAYHDGDLIGFLEEFSQLKNGFYPIDRCSIRRLSDAVNDPGAAHIEAECLLDWVTLKDKRTPSARNAQGQPS
jgi:hypothetical protein